jgi:hypothetical protein
MQTQVTLSEDVRVQLEEQGRAEGKTVDELLDEAARRLLDGRRNIGSLRAHVACNREAALARGLTEADVPRLIAEFRRERRGR